MGAVLQSMKKKKKKEEKEVTVEALIPGLPDEIAELCLLRLPSIYHPLLCSVSRSWNRAITNPSFLKSKESLFSSSIFRRPLLFLFAFHKHSGRLRWLAFDPSTHLWLDIPDMPFPAVTRSVWPLITCYSTAEQGKLRVTMNRTESSSISTTVLVYDTMTNKWSPAISSPGVEEGWRSKKLPYVYVGEGRTVAGAAEMMFWIANRARKGSGRRGVEGDRFLWEKLRRPMEVTTIEGRVYVASSGLDVVIGSLMEEEGERVKLRWEVVEAPKAFTVFVPICSIVLYA